MIIQQGWSYVCIKEVCESIIDCVNKTAPAISYPTEYKMIRTTNVKKGWIDLSEVKYVTREIFERWTRRTTLRKGDVILTREAPLGEVGMLRIDDKVFLGQRLVLYRANPMMLDNYFLLYSFQYDDLQAQIKSFGSGSTVEHMRVPDAEKLQILLPPLLTQHKIAAILSAYDDLIANNTRRIAILEEMAQSLYQEWFVHFRFPGHQKNRMVDSTLGMIPEKWEAVKLGDISSFINRGISPKYDESSEGIVINQKCIRNGHLTLEEARGHSTKFPAFKLVRFGDVLINSTGIGTLGRVTQVYQAIPNCIVDSHVTIVRPKGDINVDFFGYYLLNLQSHFESLGVGSTGQTELSREGIANTNVLQPSKNIQETFAAFVSPMRGSIIQLLTKNANLRQTRNLLLPKLISGKIHVEGLEIYSNGRTYESSREPTATIS